VPLVLNNPSTQGEEGRGKETRYAGVLAAYTLSISMVIIVVRGSGARKL